MSHQELIEEIKKVIVPLFEEEDAVLVELAGARSREGLILKILADKREGGITLSECAGLNRKIRDFLETQGMMQEDFLLEVSSPGLDRPLETKADFARCKNKKVMVFLNEPHEGRVQIEGLILGIDGDVLSLAADQKMILIPLSKIKKAKQIISG